MTSLAAVKGDVGALKAIYGDDFQWRGTPEECSNWDGAIIEEQEGTTALLHKCLPLSFIITLQSPSLLEILVSYSSANDADDSLSPSISLRSTYLGRAAQDKLIMDTNDHLYSLTRMEDYKEGGLLVDVIAFIHEKLEEYTNDSKDPQAPSKPNDDTTTEDPSSPSSSRPIILKRALLWSHHLKATSKRKDIIEWSSELSLWCISKAGYPGIIIIEGVEEDVDEFLRRIKRLTWKALQVRSEESFNASTGAGAGAGAGATSFSVKSYVLGNCSPLRLAVIDNMDNNNGNLSSPVKPTAIELESMSQVSSRMEKAGLKELFLSAAMKF